MVDKFKIEDGIVICEAHSGKTYELTEESCTCKGFGFRRACRHIKGAKEKGFFEKVENSFPAASFPGTALNRTMRKMRLKALIIFLKSCKFQPTREMIKAIEPRISKTTSPEQVYGWAEEFQKEVEINAKG